MIFLVNDWAEKTSILEQLTPGWVLHFEIVLQKLSLRSSILVLVFTVNNSYETDILFGNLDTSWLRFVEFHFEDEIWVSIFTSFPLSFFFTLVVIDILEFL